MLNKVEELSAFLAARLYLYTLFQSLLGNEPSSDQLQAIDNELAKEAFEVVFSEEMTVPIRFLLLPRDANAEELKKEYTRLFVGPHALKAPPWESMYSSDRILFTRETLEIRNTYRSQGFIPVAYPHVADDHIAIELDFMAKLAAQALSEADAEISDEPEASEATLKASLRFLSDHLLNWVPKYAEDLRGETGVFYHEVVDALLSFLRKDADGLRTILSP